MRPWRICPKRRRDAKDSRRAPPAVKSLSNVAKRWSLRRRGSKHRHVFRIMSGHLQPSCDSSWGGGRPSQGGRDDMSQRRASHEPGRFPANWLLSWCFAARRVNRHYERHFAKEGTRQTSSRSATEMGVAWWAHGKLAREEAPDTRPGRLPRL
ncbi:hypothetical protein B0T10DRAFT_248596 [Thelonectria olida]|uniref:Uncharacterized protein n=1 Tax=Thelonectria olida TaxID=1576542 RepID=A0A9P8W8T1_9HYPO|nr:hypothetical protein B0T10DRAFT_248596 [Thelonectria olida]